MNETDRAYLQGMIAALKGSLHRTLSDGERLSDTKEPAYMMGFYKQAVKQAVANIENMTGYIEPKG